MASQLAKFDGCAAMVFHHDVDGPADGTSDDAKAAWQSVVDAIAEGAVVAERESEGLPADSVIAAAPLRTIEAWLLADEEAVSATAAPGGADVRTEASDPEALWGKKSDRNSAHPKRVFQRVMGGPARKVATRDYRAVADVVRISELERRCPIAFGAFRQRVAAVIS